MLNIDGKILDLLDAEEYYLLSILLNYGKKSHPDNDVLMHRTGWGKRKVQKVKKSLIQKNIIQANTRFKKVEGKYYRASNEYIIVSDLVSKFYGAKSEQFNFERVQIEVLQNEVVQVEVHQNSTSNKVLKLSIIETIKLLKERIIADFKNQLASSPPEKVNLEEDNLQPKIQTAEKKEKSCAKKEQKIEPIAEQAEYQEETTKVLDYLSTKTGQVFKMPKTKKDLEQYEPYQLIAKLLQKEFEVLDFQKVIDVKFKEWWEDKKMGKYLRPETLFKESKFEGYLNQFYLEQNHPTENDYTQQSSSSPSKSTIRRTGAIPPEFNQAADAILAAYGGADGARYLDGFRKGSHKLNAYRTT